MEILSTIKVFGGLLTRYRHYSNETSTKMTFSVYFPDDLTTINANNRNFNKKENQLQHVRIPYILYLSGLTCTDENVCMKSGIFKILAEKKMGFVAPDTSPRDAGLPGEKDAWDFGEGAGFYLDATTEPWCDNYRMYSYIINELTLILEHKFPVLDKNRCGITGHSMGGHGALMLALRHPEYFKSVSAFSPICHPSMCPWGQKAFRGYLKSEEEWGAFDATEILGVGNFKKDHFKDILIDVGKDDKFLLAGQLLPEDFQLAAETVGQNVQVRYHDGYDHSYYFVASFIDEHVEFHARYL